MKKLASYLLVACVFIFVLTSCAKEPSLDAAMQAARKYMTSANPSCEWTVLKNQEFNTIIVEHIYTNYYIDPAGPISSYDIDEWNELIDIFVAANIATKATMDDTGYIADCIYYIYDEVLPGKPLLSILNGEITHNYLDGVVDTYITLAKYNEIEMGMSYGRVCKIIGMEGELLSAVDLAIGSEYVTESYVWYAADGIGAATIMFQGGRVVSMAQVGL